EVVEDLARRAGISVDASALSGFVDGFALEGVSDLRTALAPLEAAFAIQVVERDGILTFQQGSGALHLLDLSNVVEGRLRFDRQLIDKQPGRIVLTYIDGEGSYEATTAEARSDKGDRDYTIHLNLPMVLGRSRARDMAGRLLAETLLSDNAQVSLGPCSTGYEPGDHVQIDGVVWSMNTVRDEGLRRDIGLLPIRGGDVLRAVEPPGASDPVPIRAMPETVLIDAIAGEGPLIGVTARPWAGRVRISDGPDISTLSERLLIDAPAGIGQCLEPLEVGPIGRWDRKASLLVEIPGGDLSSITDLAALASSNALFVEGDQNWELIAFADAELIGDDIWRLTGLLRGQAGTQPVSTGSGARVVIADARLQEVALRDEEVGLDLIWRAGDADPLLFRFEDRGGLPLPVGHVRRIGGELRWTRRGRDVSDNWLLPEASDQGDYLIEWRSGVSVIASQETPQPQIPVYQGADIVRIAQRGTDGRVGPWVSISLNAS
ncbi:MAG: phage tail protein, partial [Pseudomonadota bacterium]